MSFVISEHDNKKLDRVADAAALWGAFFRYWDRDAIYEKVNSFTLAGGCQPTIYFNRSGTQLNTRDVFCRIGERELQRFVVGRLNDAYIAYKAHLSSGKVADWAKSFHREFAPRYVAQVLVPELFAVVDENLSELRLTRGGEL